MAQSRQVRLKVIDVPCATCIVPIRKSLVGREGINSIGTNYVADLILVDYDPRKVTESKIVEIIKKVGYKAIPLHQ